jgi:prepilin-type N-terminal cleavage/methylation domain-containing protein
MILSLCRAMNKTRRPALGRGGFSLIELLTVLVLVGILSQIAAPSLLGMVRTWRSKQAADQLSADLAYARLVAIRSGVGAAIVFEGDTGYRITEGTGASAPVQKRVDLTLDYGPVRLQVPDGVAQIHFNSRGMALQGSGVFVLEARAGGAMRADTLWLSALGMVRRES